MAKPDEGATGDFQGNKHARSDVRKYRKRANENGPASRRSAVKRRPKEIFASTEAPPFAPFPSWIHLLVNGVLFLEAGRGHAFAVSFRGQSAPEIGKNVARSTSETSPFAPTHPLCPAPKFRVFIGGAEILSIPLLIRNFLRLDPRLALHLALHPREPRIYPE